MAQGVMQALELFRSQFLGYIRPYLAFAAAAAQFEKRSIVHP